LPAFPRSTVDGYAVRAVDTYGASETLPAYLTLVGEIPMGRAPGFRLDASQCALIHTGGMLPEGADAVVMVEHTQKVIRSEPTRNLLPVSGDIEILRAVGVAENILKVGEDVTLGEQVIPAGKRIRPAEIGGLMALGITHLEVARRPKVGVISSGDEVVPPTVVPEPGQVRDVNAYALAALVEEAGGLPCLYGIIPDRADSLNTVAQTALQECDLVVITAGSSASARDLTAQVINNLGMPGVIVHGINVRPGKPTILAVCNGKAVIGLPGNPVSALVIAGLFVRPVISALLGITQPKPLPSISARLTLNLPSQAGREDWVAVRLISTNSGYLAEPVFGKSNLIFSLCRADGLVRIAPDITGLSKGEMVEVVLL
jgi:molybdopterin molybdotransferase